MNGSDDADTAKWDPVFTRQVKNAVGPVVKRYLRAEVNGLESLPASGGALVVSMHSGGVLTPDVLILRRRSTTPRKRPPALHPGAYRCGSRPARDIVLACRRHRGPPRQRCNGSSFRWRGARISRRRLRRIPARPYGQHRLTSMAAPVTFERPLRQVCRSSRRCRSADRKPSSSSPAETRWPNGWGCTGSGSRRCR